MISPGQRIAVALSGGKDSTALLWMLAYVNRYSYLHFDLAGMHVRTDDYDTSPLAGLCRDLELPYYEASLEPTREAPDKNICYLCARLKRGALSDLLKRHGMQTIAYGHHATDAAETFFMNIIESGKLGSFSPRVGFDDNAMVMIRPMIYLTEKTVAAIHAHAGLPVLAGRCPYETRNVRAVYKDRIRRLDDIFNVDHFDRKLVAALENPDRSNDWPAVAASDERED